MKKIGISSVYTGFNYGSALQSFATKKILEELGYEGVNLSEKGSVIKGRDVRIKKMFVIGYRLLFQFRNMKNRVSVYKKSVSKPYSDITREKFYDFYKNYVNPYHCSWKEMKKVGKQEDFVAFLCGSDQIWSGEALYVDPQYYLRYAPENKRIAFAPSFGGDSIAEQNINTISKYIKEIPSISVREKSGVSIIKEIANREATHLVDPTLLLSKEQWNQCLGLNKLAKENEEYILAYFLSEPSKCTVDFLLELSRKYEAKIISLPYMREESNWFDFSLDAGPLEFVNLVRNAKFVCTDSFHGTAFSVIYQVPFFTFDRQYGSAKSQSTRVTSFLELVSLSDRYDVNIDDMNKPIDFDKSQRVLNEEKEKSIQYLKDSIMKTERNL